MSNSTAGYSGTPLWKKLGINEASLCCFLNAPDHLGELLSGAPPYVETQAKGADLTLLFTNAFDVLHSELPRLQNEIARNGMIWVCWYKKASKKPTELTEDIVRNLALSLDLVDVKVCAVDADWSGLKLVIRKHLR